MSLSIRQGRYEDIASIVSLYAEATKLMRQTAPPGFGKALESPLDIADERESFARALGDRGRVVLIAQQGGNVVGFVMGAVENHPDDLLCAPYLTVQYLCVGEKSRRAGIGRSLMQAIEDWAADKRLSTLELTVWDNNAPAKVLFHSLGYLSLEVRMAKRIEDKAK